MSELTTKTLKTPSGEIELYLDQTHFAYKNKIMFSVWATAKSYCAGNCIGKIRYVLGYEDKIRATAWPLMNFDNGYELITKETIDSYKQLAYAYDNM